MADQAQRPGQVQEEAHDALPQALSLGVRRGRLPGGQARGRQPRGDLRRDFDPELVFGQGAAFQHPQGLVRDQFQHCLRLQLHFLQAGLDAPDEVAQLLFPLGQNAAGEQVRLSGGEDVGGRPQAPGLEEAFFTVQGAVNLLRLQGLHPGVQRLGGRAGRGILHPGAGGGLQRAGGQPPGEVLALQAKGEHPGAVWLDGF